VTRAVLHPVALAALLALGLNDHVLKAAWPCWWTGKLSDVAGLAVFPLLVAAALELLSGKPVRRGVVLALALAVGVGFAAIKLSPLAGDAYRIGLAMLQWPARATVAALSGAAMPPIGRVQLTPDGSDLLALPALAVSPWLAARAPRWLSSLPASARRPAPAAAPDRSR
jgi:hypothetical protein